MIGRLALMCLLLCQAIPAMAEPSVAVAGYSHEEAMRLGERMYREGLLPSGEPMQALVQLDIPVDGTMFTCDNCHLRSGLGTVEGTIITLPTNGAKLYRTLRAGAEIETRPTRANLSKSFQGGDVRPAYTDETLADALWNGVSPSGRELNWTMPRYTLDEPDMQVLVYYLKNLSAEYSPGVTDKEIRFATVIAEGVPASDREAMLLTLQAVVKDRNAQSRHQELRAIKGPFYKQDKFSAYRRTVLDVWQLRGPRETWREQLEAYYQANPVFALLGGIVDGDWAPVHEFSEEMKIPCIFPVTDFPVIDTDDWYTLYFSKGPYQEGETAARYLRNMNLDEQTPVIQVYADNPAGHRLAEGFRQTWKMFGRTLAVDRVVGPSSPVDGAFWQEMTSRYPDAVFALWLEPGEVSDLLLLANDKPGTPAIFMSSGLVREEIAAVPQKSRDFVYLTYPHRLPGQKAGIEKMVRSWLATRKIPVTDIDIQAKMYFLGWMMTGTTRMMGDDFYRDYLLDIFDMMHDESYALASYPRVSFGPGQRYAAKGCYVVKLDDSPHHEFTPVSNWVVQ